MTEEISFGRQLTLLANRHPEATALVYAHRDGGEDEIEWADVERRANQTAHLLVERGVVAGDLVVVGLKNSPEHVYATFGAWKLGASVLPLRYDLPAWERGRLLELAAARVVIGDWDDAEGDVISSATLQAGTHQPVTPPPDQVPESTRMIATSGSTGRPKIIVTPNRGVMVTDPQMAVASRVQAPDQVYLVASPLYHTNGFSFCCPILLEDQKVVLMERFDAERAVELIERYGVTVTVMVPTMLMRIARLPEVRSRDFSSLQRVIYGGASIPEWVVRVWLELIPPERFQFTYGSSEGVGVVITTGREWLTHPGTTGQPVACDLKILDGEGREVPTGEVGEVFMRNHSGVTPFRYIGTVMPEATPEGFMSIGDMGWVDDEGFLYIADRRQDMIITGGANVFPAEVEAALSEHPKVQDQVVVGLPDPEWGQRIHAIVEPIDAADPPTVEDLRAHCRDRLGSYKVPKTFEVIDAMPRTAAGKVNRTALTAERTTQPAG